VKTGSINSGTGTKEGKNSPPKKRRKKNEELQELDVLSEGLEVIPGACIYFSYH
jgi:hypothetical protein